MTQQSYLKISGFLFVIVAIVHGVRIFNSWPMVFGPYQISMWFSWVAAIITGILGLHALWYASRYKY